MWLCVHKLCVNKLCVSKLCEDKLCVHKLCVDKCVEQEVFSPWHKRKIAPWRIQNGLDLFPVSI